MLSGLERNTSNTTAFMTPPPSPGNEIAFAALGLFTLVRVYKSYCTSDTYRLESRHSRDSGTISVNICFKRSSFGARIVGVETFIVVSPVCSLVRRLNVLFVYRVNVIVCLSVGELPFSVVFVGIYFLVGIGTEISMGIVVVELHSLICTFFSFVVR